MDDLISFVEANPTTHLVDLGEQSSLLVSQIAMLSPLKTEVDLPSVASSKNELLNKLETSWCKYNSCSSHRFMKKMSAELFSIDICTAFWLHQRRLLRLASWIELVGPIIASHQLSMLCLRGTMKQVEHSLKENSSSVLNQELELFDDIVICLVMDWQQQVLIHGCEVSNSHTLGNLKSPIPVSLHEVMSLLGTGGSLYSLERRVCCVRFLSLVSKVEKAHPSNGSSSTLSSIPYLKRKHQNNKALSIHSFPLLTEQIKILLSNRQDIYSPTHTTNETVYEFGVSDTTVEIVSDMFYEMEAFTSYIVMLFKSCSLDHILLSNILYAVEFGSIIRSNAPKTKVSQTGNEKYLHSKRATRNASVKFMMHARGSELLDESLPTVVELSKKIENKHHLENHVASKDEFVVNWGLIMPFLRALTSIKLNNAQNACNLYTLLQSLALPSLSCMHLVEKNGKVYSVTEKCITSKTQNGKTIHNFMLSPSREIVDQLIRYIKETHEMTSKCLTKACLLCKNSMQVNSSDADLSSQETPLSDTFSRGMLLASCTRGTLQFQTDDFLSTEWVAGSKDIVEDQGGNRSEDDILIESRVKVVLGLLKSQESQVDGSLFRAWFHVCFCAQTEASSSVSSISSYDLIDNVLASLQSEGIIISQATLQSSLSSTLMDGASSYRPGQNQFFGLLIHSKQDSCTFCEYLTDIVPVCDVWLLTTLAKELRPFQSNVFQEKFRDLRSLCKVRIEELTVNPHGNKSNHNQEKRDNWLSSLTTNGESRLMINNRQLLQNRSVLEKQAHDKAFTLLAKFESSHLSRTVDGTIDTTTKENDSFMVFLEPYIESIVNKKRGKERTGKNEVNESMNRVTVKKEWQIIKSLLLEHPKDASSTNNKEIQAEPSLISRVHLAKELTKLKLISIQEYSLFKKAVHVAQTQNRPQDASQHPLSRVQVFMKTIHLKIFAVHDGEPIENEAQFDMTFNATKQEQLNKEFSTMVNQLKGVADMEACSEFVLDAWHACTCHSFGLVEAFELENASSAATNNKEAILSKQHQKQTKSLLAWEKEFLSMLSSIGDDTLMELVRNRVFTLLQQSALNFTISTKDTEDDKSLDSFQFYSLCSLVVHLFSAQRIVQLLTDVCEGSFRIPGVPFLGYCRLLILMTQLLHRHDRNEDHGVTAMDGIASCTYHFLCRHIYWQRTRLKALVSSGTNKSMVSVTAIINGLDACWELPLIQRCCEESENSYRDMSRLREWILLEAAFVSQSTQSTAAEHTTSSTGAMQQTVLFALKQQHQSTPRDYLLNEEAEALACSHQLAECQKDLFELIEGMICFHDDMSFRGEEVRAKVELQQCLLTLFHFKCQEFNTFLAMEAPPPSLLCQQPGLELFSLIVESFNLSITGGVNISDISSHEKEVLNVRAEHALELIEKLGTSIDLTNQPAKASVNKTCRFLNELVSKGCLGELKSIWSASVHTKIQHLLVPTYSSNHMFTETLFSCPTLLTLRRSMKQANIRGYLFSQNPKSIIMYMYSSHINPPSETSSNDWPDVRQVWRQLCEVMSTDLTHVDLVKLDTVKRSLEKLYLSSELTAYLVLSCTLTKLVTTTLPLQEGNHITSAFTQFKLILNHLDVAERVIRETIVDLYVDITLKYPISTCFLPPSCSSSLVTSFSLSQCLSFLLHAMNGQLSNMDEASKFDYLNQLASCCEFGSIHKQLVMRYHQESVARWLFYLCLLKNVKETSLNEMVVHQAIRAYIEVMNFVKQSEHGDNASDQQVHIFKKRKTCSSTPVLKSVFEGLKLAACRDVEGCGHWWCYLFEGQCIRAVIRKVLTSPSSGAKEPAFKKLRSENASLWSELMAVDNDLTIELGVS